MSLSPNADPVPTPTALSSRWHAAATGAIVTAKTATLAVTPTAVVVTALTAPTMLVTTAPALVVYAVPPHLPVLKGAFASVVAIPATLACGYAPARTAAPVGEPLVAWEARVGPAAAIFFEHTIAGAIVCAGCGASFASHRAWADHTRIDLPETAYLKRTPQGLVRAKLTLAACAPVDVAATAVRPEALAARLKGHGVDRRAPLPLALAGPGAGPDQAGVRPGDHRAAR
jgi:hypothetical protein